MGDLPGPMKPLLGVHEEEEEQGRSKTLDPGELMAEFRRLMATTGERPDRGPTNVGSVTGRSGRYLGRKVRDRHKMVVMLGVCGWTNKEIAQQMGYTEGRVSIILNSQRQELAEVRKQTVTRVMDNTVDLTAKIRMAATDALDKMVTLIDSKDEKIAVRAAADILDRAGYTPVKKTLNAHATVPVDELNGVLGKIQEANQVDGNNEAWEVRTLPVERKEKLA